MVSTHTPFKLIKHQYDSFKLYTCNIKG